MAKAKEETKDVLAEKLKLLEEKYGIGTIIKGKDVKEELEFVPTGSLTFDIATNIGGHPVGKLIEVFGHESSGKSTLTLCAIAGFQKLKGSCVLVDFEQSFDRVYATALGVQVDELLIVQPECQEDGYNIIDELIKTGKIRLVVIDSHTTAMPRKVVEGEVGDQTVGLQARINSQALGKIKPYLKPNRCTIMAISQLRQQIGNPYGDPNQPTGGLAYKFYSDLRYKVSKTLDKDNGLNKTVVEIIKNKCAPPWGIARFNINWGKGIDIAQEIISLAVEYKILQKGGAWFTIGETKIQGEEKMGEFLMDNPEFMSKLKSDVIKKIAGG